ncbi:hypothetical protein C1632_14055 [Microbacterium testaceum]|uniref:DUF262 domain-containing protein n=1 Tax=Microbacterium testaceum TaxID=2033 RepID=UPI000CCE4E34|nr:DUF262 domain-containing protein [Microbacterium testaceum]PNW07912.1 hypothetical protein C1632_14055 [Microbacterium testaceum]
MNETRSQDIPLEALLEGVHTGQVALPDFQRDFDWSDGEIRALVATVLMNWPVGSILLIEGSSNQEFYAPRAFEGAPASVGDLVYIVLDGQQRLTSLYFALHGVGPLRYFLKLEKNADYGDVNVIDELLISQAAEKPTSEDSRRQHESGLLPLTALASPDAFYEWRDSLGGDSADQAWLTKIYRKHFSHLAKFRMPAVIVDSEIAPAAIARVFQRVNQGGMKLGSFDLMVAKTYSPRFNLRAAWETSKVSFPSLRRHLDDDGLPILTVLALRYLGDVRQSSVLKLTEETVRENWADAAEHYATAIEFVEQEFGVLDSNWVPYGQMLTVLGAVAYEHDLNSIRQEVARWFWTTGFGHRYDSASNTRAVSDYKRIKDGQRESWDELRFIREEIVESTRGKRGSVHRSYLCALGASATKEMRALLPEVSPVSIFGRRTGGESLHLRTLSFILQDPKGDRVDTLGMDKIQTQAYASAADEQIRRLLDFLKTDADIRARVLSQDEEDARLADERAVVDGK